jgi:hypothetical protein
MTEDGAEGRRAPRRFRRLKFNPLRDVLPIVGVMIGAFLAIRAVLELSDGGDPTLVYVGSGLIVVAVSVFFVNRWQAGRGL